MDGVGEQVGLFEVPGVDDAHGFRGPVAAHVAGISYRQLDYWARTGLVEPSLRPASGSGSQRLYSFLDVVALSIVKRLLSTGISLANVRGALATMRAYGAHDVAGITLVSDGVGVYLCRGDDEVIDLVRGGQAVIGLALGKVLGDVAAAVTDAVHAEAGDQPPVAGRPALRVVS